MLSEGKKNAARERLYLVNDSGPGQIGASEVGPTVGVAPCSITTSLVASRSTSVELSFFVCYVLLVVLALLRHAVRLFSSV